MTGGVGFSGDAMNTGRSNRANRTSSHAKFKDGQDTYLIGNEPLKFKQASDEELLKIRNEILEEAKKERSKTLIIGFVLVVIAIVIVLYLFFEFVNWITGFLREQPYPNFGNLISFGPCSLVRSNVVLLGFGYIFLRCLHEIITPSPIHPIDVVTTKKQTILNTTIL